MTWRAQAATVGLLLAAPVAARQAIGVYGGWGAFRDAVPPRCFAIARPLAAGGRTGGFASVATWPGVARRSLRNVLHIRLSAAADPGAAVTLSVGDRRFVLVGRGADAWAADAATDRAVIAAMRSGRSMSAEAVGPRGRAFADSYALAGAATAIDAAALACAGR